MKFAKIGVERLSVGTLQVNCYLVWDDTSGRGLIIDPGDDAPGILQMIQKTGVKPGFILNTHGHFDHTGANALIREKTGAKIGIHLLDAALLEKSDLSGASVFGFPFTPHKPDFTFDDEYVLECARMRIKCVHTPGHTPGSSCFFLENDVDVPLLFSGDTLFCGGVGRTDLPGGSFPALKKSLNKLFRFIPPQTIVLPGHGPRSVLSGEADAL